MFKYVPLIALLFATANAMAPGAEIPVNTRAGRSLMSQARLLEEEDEQDDDDMTWVAGYSIKYLGCSSLIQVREEGGNAEEGESNLFTMNLVKFGLCPSGSSCSGCGSGKAQYVVNMEAFVNAYTEMQMNAQEQACENIREACSCDDDGNDDEEACENQCYYNMGMSDCIEVEGEEEFNAQEYLECRELEGADGNNNNNYNNNGVNMYQQYYVGPVCSNGFDINLSVFLDNGCSTPAKNKGKGIFEAFNYGKSLPYAKSPIVSKGCVSCQAVDEDANNNNNNNGNDDEDVEILELCEESIEEAAKCETGLSGYKSYPDTSGCQYINKILPKLEKASKSVITYTKKHSGSGGSASVGWAVFFAITAVASSGLAFYLYRKIHRAKVNLSASEGAELA